LGILKESRKSSTIVAKNPERILLNLIESLEVSKKKVHGKKLKFGYTFLEHLTILKYLQRISQESPRKKMRFK